MRGLRILMTADPELPVPPRLYGGIERIIDLLIEGLTARGHHVTLVAHRDSTTRATLVPYPSATSHGLLPLARHAALVTSTALRVRPHLVQSFGRVAYLLPLLASRTNVVMSYQRAVTPRSVTWATRLSRGGLLWTACSRHLVPSADACGAWRVIYNAVPVQRMPYTTRVADDAPLMFLGRIEPIKGAHTAIAVARRAGRRLVIAGNVPGDLVSQTYFRTEIEPFVDGDVVRYVGPVDDEQKARWLTRAAALLMPIQWEEPFGIVMAEALACGTPVIGLRRGAVPEVVDQGLTGFVCADPDEMIRAVGAIDTLSRSRCRQAAEDRFSQKSLVDAYESVYAELLDARPSVASARRQVAGA